MSHIDKKSVGDFLSVATFNLDNMTQKKKAPETHSPTGASTMKRWENCPGSIALCKGIPNPSSEYAEEGTKAHEAAAHFLTYGEFPKGTPLDMIEAVMVYINSIFDDERSALAVKGFKSWTEHGFDLSKLCAGLFGTADCVIYYPAAKLLQVWDYKHGAGVAVEVKENEQLMYYGLGALLTLEHEFENGVETVELIICQPRKPHEDGPVRRWSTTAEYLKKVFAPRLVAAKKATEKKNAPLKAGEHCRFCPAGGAGVCTEIHNKALRSAQDEFKIGDFTETAITEKSYNPEKLAAIMEWIPTFKAWISSVEEFAENALKAGGQIPGFKLVQTQGRRKWREGVTADVLSMELGIDSDKLKSFSLLTPPQVEKLVGKKERPIIDQLTTVSSSGVTIAKHDDKRPSAILDPAVEFAGTMPAEFSLLD